MARRKLDLCSVNERLKAARIPVSVVQRGDRLSLRGTLPPRPGSGKLKPSQQTVSLGVVANPEGFAYAESKALEVGALLSQKRFSWEDFGEGMEPATNCQGSCADIIQRFKEHWLANEVDLNDEAIAELRWIERFWGPAYQWLPEDEPLTAALLIKTVQRWKSNKRSRQIACQRFARLAKFAGVEVDLKPFQGSYGIQSVEPRDIPTDEQIEEWRDLLIDPGWQRVYGLIAAFGLRPHEAFFCELVDEWTLKVLEGKTGSRITRALHPEWVEKWDLATVVAPTVKGRTHREYGQRVRQYFSRRGVPTNPYNFRHAWCIRASVIYKLPVAIAAQMAGHSVAVHTQVYSRWIRDDQALQVYQDIALKGR